MSRALDLTARPDRSTAMQVVHESYALALHAERLAEAEARRTADRLVSALRAQRRAARAERRAQRRLTMAGLG